MYFNQQTFDRWEFHQVYDTRTNLNFNGNGILWDFQENKDDRKHSQFEAIDYSIWYSCDLKGR